jgi:hypothetical protein
MVTWTVTGILGGGERFADMRSRRYSILDVRVKLAEGIRQVISNAPLTAYFLSLNVISMFFGLLLVKCESMDKGIMHSANNLRIRLRGWQVTAESSYKTLGEFDSHSPKNIPITSRQTHYVYIYKL